MGISERDLGKGILYTSDGTPIGEVGSGGVEFTVDDTAPQGTDHKPGVSGRGIAIVGHGGSGTMKLTAAMQAALFTGYAAKDVMEAENQIQARISTLRALGLKQDIIDHIVEQARASGYQSPEPNSVVTLRVLDDYINAITFTDKAAAVTMLNRLLETGGADPFRKLENEVRRPAGPNRKQRRAKAKGRHSGGKMKKNSSSRKA